MANQSAQKQEPGPTASQQSQGQADKWFYQAPNQKKEPSKVGPPAVVMSQIPDLNTMDMPGSMTEDEIAEAKNKRKWIRDTDTDYIKLAKEGGHRNLLVFRERSNHERKKVNYPRVDWFDHDRRPEDGGEEVGPVMAPQAPEWYKYDSPITSVAGVEWEHMKDQRTILGYDKLTTWQRNNVEPESDKVKKKNKRGKQAMKNQVVLPQINPAHRRQLSAEDQGEISTIMKYGYQKQFLDDMTERDQRMVVAKKKEAINLVEKAKMDYRPPKKPSSVETKKKPFRMSKFDNATSTIDNRRPRPAVS